MTGAEKTPDRDQSEAKTGYDARLRRAQGCLLGQLAGDALGSMVEFKSGAEIARRYPGGLRRIEPSPVWGTLAGQPTDDSEMALALARSIIPDGYSDEAAARAYAEWRLSRPFDVGNTVRRATDGMVAAISRGENVSDAARRAANPKSEANGALMRQSPLAIWGSWLEPEILDGFVRADTTLTHPNQVCQDASAAFIVAVAATIRDGLDGRLAYDIACEWDSKHGQSPSVTEALEAAASQTPNYELHKGYVLVALQNAFYQALHASTFEEGVVVTVMGGGDTDTNAAIAGALLGAIYGVDAIPLQWQEAVLNCRPEKGAVGVWRPRPETYWPVDALELADSLHHAGLGYSIRWKQENDPRSTQELINLALAAEDEDTQWELASILWYRTTYDVVEAARELSEDPDARKRILAARILGRGGRKGAAFPEETSAVLLSMLEKEQDPDVISQVCACLGDNREVRAIPGLIALKSHPHEDVRWGVAVGLLGQDDDRAIETLIELSTDEDENVRDWATFGLGSILEEVDTPELREALVARLTDPHDDTRAEAVVGLAMRKDVRALFPLIKELENMGANAGDMFFEAAAALGDSRLCPVLMRIRALLIDADDLEEALQSCGCENQ
jgi:ADP-ribosyl-[dinitrogen reductase] hydrolase